ncbi:malonate decarboxylase holo-[acyl-carrier-protein] synthase [Roseomonas sp. HJA6]|uniref:Malonate decarboxylase holo-[acyl-carrier-protein] synthase n=1 Tax=Roseomonas alba TaxID=2846776 RepID=A0ABS7AG90_9PROT|nr:malonate decarboxylase holo-[acyl-carrier-protein] synthase [Neoroseomonas alba]MBW6401324.1 malonate decarboxylase holo-[acyl-carrier-protein] synthase [Neoroseomonas alba]
MADIPVASRRRHDLLLIASDAWRSALDRSPAMAELPFVRGWVERGWPVILRRHAEAEDNDLVAVGLPLPPGAGRHRVGLLLPSEAILRVRRPPSLRAAAWVVDPGRRPTVPALLQFGERYGVEPAVVGSLLWHHVTGLPYLTPASDLDLLWPVRRLGDIHPLLRGIARLQRDTPFRIDGEVILPDGVAGNWRELWNADTASGDIDVLGKSLAGVRLVLRASLSPVGSDA